MPQTNPTATTPRTGGRAHGSVRWGCAFTAIISSLMLVTPLAAQWWDPDWGERKKLTFRNGDEAENLVDFPVLVKLDGSRIDYFKTQNAGEDLRFIDSDHITELDHEIEKWDEAGTSYVWVKVPQIDGSSDTDHIWMYYDNPFYSPSTSVIVFDDMTPDFSSTARSSASFSHTVGAGSDPILIVIVMTRGDQGAVSVSYAAQPLTQAISEQAGTNANTEWVSIWYLTGPATGPNTVSVTFNNSKDPSAVVALSYFGVDQSDPIGATARYSSTAPELVVSEGITTTVDNSMVVGGISHHGQDTAPHTPAGAVTAERFDFVTGGTNTTDSAHAGGEIATTTAGFYMFDWTGSVADNDALACVELKPAPGVSADPTAVWSNGYVAVWHLREDPTGGGGPWYSPSWQYRKKVTIAGSKIVGTHTDFPVLISINDTDVRDGAQADGDDILFTNSDETTKLDHEIEKYDGGTGELVAWVRVPSLSAGSDKDIYLYYGNSGASNQQNAPGVWGDYVGVWHLNETSGTRVDSTSSNNDLTDQNTVASVPGIMAGGIDLERNNSERLWISDAAQTGLDITGNMTMQAWVRPESLPESISFLDKYAGTNAGYRMRIHSNSWFEYSVYDGSLNEVRSSIPVNMGTWYSTVGVYDGSNIFFYVDGTNVDSEVHSGGINTNSEEFEIGARGNGKFFDGLVDEVRICSLARSAGWLETEFSNQNNPGTFHTLGPESTGGSGAINDSTANAHNGAAHASMNVFDQVPGQIGGSLEFDGVDDEVATSSTTALDNAAAMTLEAWVKADSQFEWAGVIQKRSSASSLVPVALEVRGSGVPRFGVWTSTFTPIESAPALSNEWTHLVGVYDGNDLRLYRNGSLDAGPTSKTGTLAAATRPFYIGRNPFDAVTFAGGIDEVRVSDSARSADWIAAQYKSMTDTFIRRKPVIISWQEVEP